MMPGAVGAQTGADAGGFVRRLDAGAQQGDGGRQPV